MSDDVYYTMKRGWMDHPALMPSEPFTRAQAFEWLVSRASMNTARIDVMGKTVSVRRGQLCMSYRALAEAWNWDLGKVQRFIARLKTDTLIDTESSHGRMMITVCNYEGFDVRKSPRPTTTDTLSGTRTIQEQYAVDTQSKKIDDNNNAGAREGPGTIDAPEVPTAAVAEPAEPMPLPAGRDPNEHAIIQALIDISNEVFSPEGVRFSAHNTDELWARQFMSLGRDLGFDPGKVIDLLRGHFSEQCEKLKRQGDQPPAMLKFFRASVPKLLRSYARDRDTPVDRATPPNGSAGNRPRYGGGNGGDAPTSNTAEQPWQRVQKHLIATKQIDAAKQLSAASKHGAAAANQLAAELEGRLLAKQRPAARAA